MLNRKEKQWPFAYMVLIVLLISSFIFPAKGNAPADGPVNNKKNSQKLKVIGAIAKEFTRAKGFNTAICFLIDFSINSGRSRFFVFDLQKDSVVQEGLVTHGSCNTLFQYNARFSNEPGCGCSSSGRYKVGNKYSGIFGTAYKLLGLDSSNSHAYNRAIVLHAHSCVPDKECYPNQICNSQGCITVSPEFLKKLSTAIDSAKKPLLMWVFQ